MEAQTQIDLFTNRLKEALENKDFDAGGEAFSNLVGACVTAKINREDRQHNELIEQLSGIRNALELQAILAVRMSPEDECGVAVPLMVHEILKRLNLDKASVASDPSVGEPVE